MIYRCVVLTSAEEKVFSCMLQARSKPSQYRLSSWKTNVLKYQDSLDESLYNIVSTYLGKTTSRQFKKFLSQNFLLDLFSKNLIYSFKKNDL